MSMKSTEATILFTVQQSSNLHPRLTQLRNSSVPWRNDLRPAGHRCLGGSSVNSCQTGGVGTIQKDRVDRGMWDFGTDGGYLLLQSHESKNVQYEYEDEQRKRQYERLLYCFYWRLLSLRPTMETKRLPPNTHSVQDCPLPPPLSC